MKMNEFGGKDAVIKQTFLWHILNIYTPTNVLKDQLMRPIPKQVGHIQCTVERKKNGFNKLFPVFHLKLVDGNKYMLKAEKVPNSATSNYRISLVQSRGIENIEV